MGNLFNLGVFNEINKRREEEENKQESPKPLTKTPKIEVESMSDKAERKKEEEKIILKDLKDADSFKKIVSFVEGNGKALRNFYGSVCTSIEIKYLLNNVKNGDIVAKELSESGMWTVNIDKKRHSFYLPKEIAMQIIKIDKINKVRDSLK